MSLECPKSPVYHTSALQKRAAQKSAKMYRFGTPKLRDLLREKCRIRMQETRQLQQDQLRGFNSNATAKFNINEVLRAELAELEEDITLQDQIYNELLDEFNEWYAAQLEHEESYIIEMETNDPKQLLCPICMQAALQHVSNDLIDDYKCICEAQFNYAGNVSKLRVALQAKIDEHERNCEQPLRFFVEPEAEPANAEQQTRRQYLSGICDNCDYFCSLN